MTETIQKRKSKVKIYTWADKAPEFLYKQYETIKKFVKDEDWEFIVFNNVPFPKLDRQIKIKKICKELGLKCYDVRFRSFVSGAAQICAWGIHWAYHRFFRWEKDTIHVIFDSDMFFIQDFNFNEYLGDNDICAIHQRRGNIEYLWNGIVIMRGGELPDKNYFDYRLGDILGERTDVGGRLYYWLKRNPDLKIRYIKHTKHLDVSNSFMLPENVRAGYKPEFSFQFIEHAVLHYRAGSNWDKKSQNFVDSKKAYFNELLEDVLHKGGKVTYTPELYVTLEEPTQEDIDRQNKYNQCKVKICTWVDKEPDFIYKQYESIKKFVKDEKFEFVVFNNTPIIQCKRRKQIKEICKELGIKCLDVRFRSLFSSAPDNNGRGIFWAYHRFFRWEKRTIHVILDSDMFFVNDFNFNAYMGDNNIAAIHRRVGDVEYLANNFAIFKGSQLPDKNHFDYRAGIVLGEKLPAGGKTAMWIRRNPRLKIRYMMHTDHENSLPLEILSENLREPYKAEYGFQFIENAVLHYRGDLDYCKGEQTLIASKKAYLSDFLDGIFAGKEKINNIPALYSWKQLSLNKKIVKLSGGLGNQMFQYALAYVLSKTFDTKVILDFTWFEEVKSNPNLTPRSFELDVFNIEYSKAIKEELDKVNYTKYTSLTKKFLWKLFKIESCKPPRNAFLQLSASDFNKNILTSNEYYYYDGYFQNEKYFKHVKTDLLKAFSSNIPLDEKNQAVLEKINNTNSVSIHVRRGDYVTLDSAHKHHGVCSLDYYTRAIDYMAKKISNPQFFLFSDDIDWVIKNLKLDYPFTVVDFNQGKGWLDMNLIKHCKHNIIANSSFSWWGAWLNENVDKIVVAPKRWNQVKFKKCDTVTADWIKL